MVTNIYFGSLMIIHWVVYSLSAPLVVYSLVVEDLFIHWVVYSLSAHWSCIPWW